MTGVPYPNVSRSKRNESEEEEESEEAEDIESDDEEELTIGASIAALLEDIRLAEDAFELELCGIKLEKIEDDEDAGSA